METTAQPNSPEYALEIIDEEACEAMEYQNLNKNTNKEIRERWT